VLKNASRLPCKFKLKLPTEAGDILQVTPAHNIIRGNDEVVLTLCFTPKEVMLYGYLLHIDIYPIGGKSSRVLDANQPGPVVLPELLQSIDINIVAQGEIGALVFSPSSLTLDVLLVHTSIEQSIYIENVSDADISYVLYYKEDFMSDSVDEEPVHIISDIMSLKPYNKNKSNSNKHTTSSTAITSSNSSRDFMHSLFCEQYKGSVSARSRLRLAFTYKPAKSGLFNFSIFAHIYTLDPSTTQPVTMLNEEVALLRTLGNEMTMFNNTRTATSNAPLIELPLSASVTARAAFPKLLIEDIRSNTENFITNINYLWTRCNLSSLNYDLSLPLTSQELTLYNSSSPDLSKLKAYHFNFTPQIQHSPAQTLTLQLRNHGYLPTQFTIQLPNEKSLQLENWCDEDEPSEELNKLICIIEELKLFEIQPRHGLLQPGETMTITISYKYTSMKYNGLHSIPLLVRIQQGKMFYITVVGRTLSPPTNRRASVRFIDPTLRTSTSNSSTSSSSSNVVNYNTANTGPDILLVIPAAAQDNKIRLEPVPIGLHYVHSSSTSTPNTIHISKINNAPLQRIEICNVCAYNVQYEVFVGDQLPDPSGPATPSDDYILKNNFYMDILHIANPRGVMQAGSSLYIELYVYPLEDKVYHISIHVKYYIDTSNITSTSSADATLTETSVITRGSNRKLGNTGNSVSTGKLRSRLRSEEDATNTTTTIKYLQHTIEVRGYDARGAYPTYIDSLYIGGKPPTSPILYKKLLPVVLVEDYVDFGHVPIQSTTHRICTLHNTNTITSYEFVIDETSCSLCVEGALAISPVYGKIPPGGRVCIDLKLAAYIHSAIYVDKLNITIREVVKITGRARGGAKAILLERIKARKVDIYIFVTSIYIACILTPYILFVERKYSTRISCWKTNIFPFDAVGYAWKQRESYRR
jgi:hypothetical protein